MLLDWASRDTPFCGFYQVFFQRSKQVTEETHPAISWDGMDQVGAAVGRFESAFAGDASPRRGLAGIEHRSVRMAGFLAMATKPRFWRRLMSLELSRKPLTTL